MVISIIAILVAPGTISWQNAQLKGRDGKRKADTKAVQEALEIYMQKNGTYPASAPDGRIQCNNGDTTIIDWGKGFGCQATGDSTPTIYMQQLPKDPAYQNITDGYFYNSTGIASYVLSAKLENDNDPENTLGPNYVPGTLPCTAAADRNYCVINP